MALDTSSSVHLPPTGSPVDVHPAAEQVRQMAEFAPPQPGLMDRLMELPWMEEWANRAKTGLQSLIEKFRDLFGQVDTGSGENLPPYLLDVVSMAAGLLLLLLGVFAFYLMLGYLRRLLAERQPKSGGIGKVFEDVLLVDAAHHRARAGDFARDGRIDLATRELYLALLCLLEERQVLSFEPTRSNAEYRTALERRSDVLQAFSGIAGVFEQSRYGGHPVTEVQYKLCEASYQEAERTLTAPHG